MTENKKLKSKKTEILSIMDKRMIANSKFLVRFSIPQKGFLEIIIDKFIDSKLAFDFDEVLAASAYTMGYVLFAKIINGMESRDRTQVFNNNDCLIVIKTCLEMDRKIEKKYLKGNLPAHEKGPFKYGRMLLEHLYEKEDLNFSMEARTLFNSYFNVRNTMVFLA